MVGTLFTLIGIAAFAAVTAFVLNWLALIPWRRTKGAHWTVRARSCYPARVAATGNLFCIPAVLTLSGLLLFPDTCPPWALVAMAAALGTIAGTIPMDAEIFPRIDATTLLRQAAVNCLQRFLIWFVFLGAIAAMPDQFDLLALAIFCAVFALRVIWGRWGMIRLGRAVGVFVPAPERLRKITSETAAKMNVQFREVLLMRSSMAQAFALIKSGTMLFTERLLEICSDDEIAAICAHELGHLTESKSARFQRSIGGLTFMPLLLLNPLIHAWGEGGFLALAGLVLVVPRFRRRISRKLEVRADEIAKANEPDAGVYARALAKIYEDGLIPAEIARKRQTHPSLYDRLLAAGAVPDYPRPKPAKIIAWHGIALSVASGLLIAIFLIRQAGG